MLKLINESEKPNSKSRHMYAVVRIDLPVSQENPENSLAVVKVFSSKMTAEREVLRLNKINSEKGCRYVMQTTRFVSSPN